MSHDQLSNDARSTFYGPEGMRGYGLGWYTTWSEDFVQFGAYATSMHIYPSRGLITVWLVQHEGSQGWLGGQAFEASVIKNLDRTDTGGSR